MTVVVKNYRKSLAVNSDGRRKDYTHYSSLKEVAEVFKETKYFDVIITKDKIILIGKHSVVIYEEEQ
jgi:hypothetical protein